MDATDSGRPDVSSLGWDDLLALKRKLSGDLKILTEKIVDLDRNKSYEITNQIKDQRNAIDTLLERQKQIRIEIEKSDDSLLSVSEKISKSKNFLSLMVARLPSEKEEELHAAVEKNQALIKSGDYKSDREKNEILSRAKDASMKLEAIRATRTIREQLAALNQESASISSATLHLNEEREASKARMSELNEMLDRLYEAKRNLAAERESCLNEYNGLANQFDAINARMDAMGEMRRKQREQYGHGLPNDALFKVKEIAKKKLESGAKLSFDELKLLYGEKD